MKLFFTLSLVLFGSTSLLGQDVNKAIAQQITTADSVLIISHLITKEYAVRVEDLPGEGQKYIEPPAFLNGRVVNDSIVKQKRLLSNTERQELSAILGLSINKTRFSATTCFYPRHSILIYRQGDMSYIDICFSCRAVVSSVDIEISRANFIEKKWTLLEQFFKAKRLTYGLTDED